ncbi:MAG: glycosyltransferase [Bacteroidota bacterium]
MLILQWIFSSLTAILLLFLLLPFVTVLLSRFRRENIQRVGSPEAPFQSCDFACIITAYKNVAITEPLVVSLLRQTHEDYIVYLVADECDISSWTLTDDRLVLLRPDPPLRLKAKSIIHAIENFRRPHEYCVVFDADNLAHPDFLKEINVYVNNGHRTIQGQRTAKNLDTVYACADSTGEFFKNYVERYAPYLIGTSSVISGSGMAVETELYKAYLNSPEIQQGKEKWKKMLQEDKILQNFLLLQNERITYAWNAIVYDEKVTTAEQVETQRSRWLFSYFQNLPNSSGILLRGIGGLSWNQFYFGLITLSPPLFILLGSSLLLAVVAFFVQPWLSLALVGGVGIFGLTILWSLYLSKVPRKIWEALWGLPLFAWNQFTALTKMGNPNKNFKHTEHNRTYTIEEVLDTGASPKEKK